MSSRADWSVAGSRRWWARAVDLKQELSRFRRIRARLRDSEPLSRLYLFSCRSKCRPAEEIQVGRPLRFIPENSDGVLIEVSCRTLEALPLLRPSRRLNEIAVGVIGRALEISPLGICGFSFLSSHYHMLLSVDDQQQLSCFMEHLQSNLSRPPLRRDRGERRARGAVGEVEVRAGERHEGRAGREPLRVAGSARGARPGRGRSPGRVLVQQDERMGGSAPRRRFRYLRLRDPVPRRARARR